MSVSVTFRTSEETKEKATQIYRALGLSISSAVNMFLEATIRENGLPIDTRLSPEYKPVYSDEELNNTFFDLPIVEAFPADWNHPDDDEYAEELLAMLEKEDKKEYAIA